MAPKHLEDLLELVKNEGTEAQICALLKKGASIEDSHAIHCCAYNRSLQHLEMLLRLVPSAEKAVNQPDDCSLLPLMLAAKGACGSLSRDTLLAGAFHSFLETCIFGGFHPWNWAVHWIYILVGQLWRLNQVICSHGGLCETHRGEG